ncbi:hypothetical protein [Sulfuricurvum sp.]|uniref:hypothetical protein n=1 Tax=Sulfuricurvum sp. TaxID=2025608 RepID=UPI003BAF50E5
MPLHYAGPKPMISQTGIEFDHNKEDKFVYMSFVAELIKALDHPYINDKRYIYTPAKAITDTDVILDLFKTYDPSLPNEIEDRKKMTEAEIDNEVEREKNNRLLLPEEREIYVKNIQLLRQYRINRAINKTVYYSGVFSLANIIHRGHISFITAPMLPVHFHVFHSIQGTLSKLHPPMSSNITIYEESGHLYTRLEIGSN